ncbi:hypothetical protein [Mesorhizobium australafricanum]|uniref:Uncharacterized protein n=1 Tax=Mesorhizobium australafricanum TaxID=3072311 RepID=A0ABU4X0B4_9HYPH|nr:hypothetical protein [Mesorhizobium sp. VK3E]MDX8440632.1 hypothetical protein [Mesorhizobium sp. VK3E]
MKIVIEFYSTRTQDDAQAIAAREMRDAPYPDKAICVARAYSPTLDTPPIGDTRAGRPYPVRLDTNDNPARTTIATKDTAVNGRSDGPDVELPAAVVCGTEGEASGQRRVDDLYGRRVEPDGTWSIYHVFTGVPAVVRGHCMTGMSRSDATRRMLSLNRRNEDAGCRPPSGRSPKADGE